MQLSSPNVVKGGQLHVRTLYCLTYVSTASDIMSLLNLKSQGLNIFFIYFSHFYYSSSNLQYSIGPNPLKTIMTKIVWAQLNVP